MLTVGGLYGHSALWCRHRLLKIRSVSESKRYKLRRQASYLSDQLYLIDRLIDSLVLSLYNSIGMHNNEAR
eukprot:scaffold7466_cov119-Skeletonema_dohrnii-CCMP3373.AAC.7